MAKSDTANTERESGNQKETVPAKGGSRAGAATRRTPEGASILSDENGRTTIYQRVVAKIAGLAVQEVRGVRRLVPSGAGQQVTSVARSLTGGEKRDLGVDVEVGAQEAAVDVRIITDYGVSIPAVADAIRRNVSERIEGMTGLSVVEVNIDVMDLYFDEGEEGEPQQGSRVQ